MNHTALCSLALLKHSWGMECLTKAASEPTTSDFNFLRTILFFKLENISKWLFKSWQIAKRVISCSKFALVWVSLLFGVFFTISLVLCPAFQMDLPTVAVLGDSFTVTAHPNCTHCEWKVKGQPLVTCPPYQHLSSLVHCLFQHCVIGWKDREVGWAQNSKIN